MSDEITKNPVGRAPVITEEVTRQLIDVFRLGVKDNAACAYAGVGRTAFYAKMQDDEEFANKIEAAKNFAVIAARQVVVKKIVDDKDVETAKWYLDRHDLKQEFGVQQNTQVNVFTSLKEKYTIKDEPKSELADIIVETKTDGQT